MNAKVTVISSPNFHDLEHPDLFDRQSRVEAKRQDQGTQAERLIEAAGRVCYDSYGKGRSSEEFHAHLVDSGHHNPAYHAYFSFKISGISRTCAMELLRHHVGATPSMRSTRYVDESESEWIDHPLLTEMQNSAFDEKLWDDIRKARDTARDAYDAVAAKLYGWLLAGGADPSWARKQARGAASRYLGGALETELVFTCNVAALRNIQRQRDTEHADREIQDLVRKMVDAAAPLCPSWLGQSLRAGDA